MYMYMIIFSNVIAVYSVICVSINILVYNNYPKYLIC